MRGVTVLARRDGRGRAAVAAYLASSRTTALWRTGEPCLGAEHRVMAGAAAFCQPAGEVAGGLGGQRRASRCFLPLPVHWTCGSASRWMSSMVSVASSDTRSPVWAASSMRAWSRRPCQVPRSGAASSASSSSRVRKFTGCLHGAFGRDGQHAGNQRGMLERTRRGAAEQRVDRGETGVAGGCCPGWFPGAAGSPLIVSRRAA